MYLQCAIFFCRSQRLRKTALCVKRKEEKEREYSQKGITNIFSKIEMLGYFSDYKNAIYIRKDNSATKTRGPVL